MSCLWGVSPVVVGRFKMFGTVQTLASPGTVASLRLLGLRARGMRRSRGTARCCCWAALGVEAFVAMYGSVQMGLELNGRRHNS